MKHGKVHGSYRRMVWIPGVLVFMLVMAAGNAFCAKENSHVKVKDVEIVNAIENEYIFDNGVPFNSIDILCEDGIVTLDGDVETIWAKERAEAIAGSIVGVRGIVNMITVKPVEIPNNKLQKAVFEALLNNPATDSYEIVVSVDDGVVTLTGNVGSWQEKQLSTVVTKEVKGVRKVNNEIVVTYKTDRSDYKIKNEIKERMLNDVRIDDKLISVEVKKGNVNLGGTVGSAAEKSRAILDAYVAGVKDVSADKLEVKWWAKNNMRREEYFYSRSDEEIEKAVKDAFGYDPRVLGFNPGVRVDDATVTLYGTVGYLGAKRAAEDDAKNVTGVLRVVNHLKVRPEPIPGNEKIKNKIIASFSKDPFIDRFAISVEVIAGFVTLSGKVNTSFEKERAETIAARTDGVIDVINNIEYMYKWTWKPDWEIKADVREQLHWDVMLTDKDIAVDVGHGVVTLTGTVDTWIEWHAAEENAYAGGAKDVINDLLIRYD